MLDGGRDHPAAAKLRLVRELLRLRRDRPERFAGYTPVTASGPAADHVLAFDRGGVLAVATRLPVGLAGERRLGRHPARPAARHLARRAHRPAGRRRRWPRCLDTLPVALLVQED